MDDNARKAELARFLRTRRSMIQPETVGLAGGRRRRTPGLRREEVASLAQVGLAWYTWLEQSRDIQVSREVIERIAKALRLSHSDTAYFRSLAGKEIANTEQGRGEELRDVQRLLDGFTAEPAMLWNERFDCLAFDHLADVIYDWSESTLPFGRNLAWRNFMDPARLGFYDERVLRSGVGLLRVRYAQHLGEPGFASLIATLLESSTAFRRFWKEQQTESLDPCRLPLHTRGSGFFDYAQSGHYTRHCPKARWLLFRLMTRQRKTYLGISLLSVGLGGSNQVEVRGSSSAYLRRESLARLLLGAGTANVFSKEHTVS